MCKEIFLNFYKLYLTVIYPRYNLSTILRNSGSITATNTKERTYKARTGIVKISPMVGLDWNVNPQIMINNTDKG